MQVAPSGGQFATRACGAIWWPNLQLMQVAPPGGQNWDQLWWHHQVVKFWTNTSGTTYNWPNLEPMQMALYLAGEINQIKESIPWVRCASGNVFFIASDMEKLSTIFSSCGKHCSIFSRTKDICWCLPTRQGSMGYKPYRRNLYDCFFELLRVFQGTERLLRTLVG